MARVTHRSGLYGAVGEISKRSRSLPILPHKVGMQPPPNDKRALRRELTRLNWSIHCLHGARSKLIVVLDRYDQKLVLLRRERDEYANALQDMDPELFEIAEQERRDMDDPKRAIEWSQRRGGTDDVL